MWKASLRCLDRRQDQPVDDEDWGGAWGRCAWCGWGGDDLEVVHRAHCHRLRVEANQSNRSLTPQPQYQLQVDWDGKSPTASHRSDEEKERMQSWQKLTFGVVAAISEPSVAEEGGGGGSFQNISKGFPKHSQPAATTFLFQSPDFRLINLVIVLLSDYSDLPNFPRSSWLHANQSILANKLIFFHYQLQQPESLNKCPTKHQDRGASSLTNTLKIVTLFHFLFNMGSVETCNINK